MLVFSAGKVSQCFVISGGSEKSYSECKISQSPFHGSFEMTKKIGIT
jgi:hypothetical protein